jgi:hypothetical protein
MKSQFLACLALPILLGSCAIGGKNEFVGDPKLLAPGREGTTQVTVLRESQLAGGGVRLSLELDGTLIARLGSGDYVQIYIPAGEHFLLMDHNHDGRRQLQRFEAKPGEPVYFRFEIFTWDLNCQWHFDRLTPEEGRKAVDSGHYDSISAAPPPKH